MRRLSLSKPAPVVTRPLQLLLGGLPSPGRGQLRLRVRACGVCHTDLHTVEGEITPPAYPIVPGHQIVGTVDAVGEGVADWAVGDRAGVAWLHAACGTCDFCQRDEENLCPRARFTGFHVDGGYAEAVLAEAAYTYAIPPGVSDEEAAPLLCAGIIGYRSLRKADLSPGETVGLVGFGASAHLALQVARRWGCTVYAFSRGERHRRLALDLGASWAGTIDQPPPAPLDRAVLFAPVGDLVPATLRLLRPGGTLAINAIHMTDIPSMPYAMLYGERTMRSVANATRRDGKEFLALAAQMGLRPTIARYALDDANQALLDLKQGRIEGAAVLIP
ncbi:MAG: zinc-dependent alcohol dehydrogenase family protein [Chloroflexi bacterium]|nr:zinc-dependent alcohol dehydrogenase family protein [Chloroflexota bacterium]